MNEGIERQAIIMIWVLCGIAISVLWLLGDLSIENFLLALALPVFATICEYFRVTKPSK